MTDYTIFSKTVSGLLAGLVACIILFAAPGKSEAHPHVFMDCELTFVFGDNGLKGIRQDWVFDEMFAAMILGEHDKDSNLKISPEEQESIYNGAFINLRGFNYFTHLKLDGKRLKVEDAEEFRAYINEGFLHYEFFLPCKIPFDGKKHRLQTAVFDDSYYTAIFVSMDNKLQDAPQDKKISLEFDSIKELAFYEGQIVPDGAILTMEP